MFKLAFIYNHESWEKEKEKSNTRVDLRTELSFSSSGSNWSAQRSLGWIHATVFLGYVVFCELLAPPLLLGAAKKPFPVWF